MARYIDAELALKLKDEGMNYVYDLTDLEDFLAGVPTADVVEVKHGKWLYSRVHILLHCSECGEIPDCFEPPYCPNCGAKMDGDLNDL